MGQILNLGRNLKNTMRSYGNNNTIQPNSKHNDTIIKGKLEFYTARIQHAYLLYS